MRPIILASCVLFSAGAGAAEYGRWSTGGGQGYLEMSVGNGPGNTFTISCDVGATLHGGANIHLQIEGRSPVPNSVVRFFVDGDEVGMSADQHGTIVTDCHVCADNFIVLWNRMRKGKQLLAVLSDNRSSPFSLKGAAMALDPEPCATDFYEK